MAIYSFSHIKELKPTAEGQRTFIIGGVVRKLKPLSPNDSIAIPVPEKYVRKRATKKIPSEIKVKKERKKRTDWKRNGKKISAEKDGKTYGPYISISECGRELNISKGHLSQIISGYRPNETGYKFNVI